MIKLFFVTHVFKRVKLIRKKKDTNLFAVKYWIT